jgi:hypothetical protein
MFSLSTVTELKLRSETFYWFFFDENFLASPSGFIVKIWVFSAIRQKTTSQLFFMMKFEVFISMKLLFSRIIVERGETFPAVYSYLSLNPESFMTQFAKQVSDFMLTDICDKHNWKQVEILNRALKISRRKFVQLSQWASVETGNSIRMLFNVLIGRLIRALWNFLMNKVMFLCFLEKASAFYSKILKFMRFLKGEKKLKKEKNLVFKFDAMKGGFWMTSGVEYGWKCTLKGLSGVFVMVTPMKDVWEGLEEWKRFRRGFEEAWKSLEEVWKSDKGLNSNWV